MLLTQRKQIINTESRPLRRRAKVGGWCSKAPNTESRPLRRRARSAGSVAKPRQGSPEAEILGLRSLYLGNYKTLNQTLNPRKTAEGRFQQQAWGLRAEGPVVQNQYPPYSITGLLLLMTT